MRHIIREPSTIKEQNSREATMTSVYACDTLIIITYSMYYSTTVVRSVRIVRWRYTVRTYYILTVVVQYC
jgi:hypothetical protein